MAVEPEPASAASGSAEVSSSSGQNPEVSAEETEEAFPCLKARLVDESGKTDEPFTRLQVRLVNESGDESSSETECLEPPSPVPYMDLEAELAKHFISTSRWEQAGAEKPREAPEAKAVEAQIVEAKADVEVTKKTADGQTSPEVAAEAGDGEIKPKAAAVSEPLPVPAGRFFGLHLYGDAEMFGAALKAPRMLAEGVEIATDDATGQNRDDVGNFVLAQRSFKKGELLMADVPIGDPKVTNLYGCEKEECIRAMMNEADASGTKVWDWLTEGELTLLCNPFGPRPEDLKVPDWAQAQGMDEDSWFFCLSMLECNALKTSQRGDDKWRIALLPWIRMMNHSCSPNACVMPKEETGRWEVFAARDIEKGEHITWSYVQDDAFVNLGVNERRERLANGWAFDCECGRCLRELEEQEKRRLAIRAKPRTRKRRVVKAEDLDKLFSQPPITMRELASKINREKTDKKDSHEKRAKTTHTS